MSYCRAKYAIGGDFDTHVECLRRRHLFGWHTGFLALSRWGQTYETTLRWRRSLDGRVFFWRPIGMEVNWLALMETAPTGVITIADHRGVREYPCRWDGD